MKVFVELEIDGMVVFTSKVLRLGLDQCIERFRSWGKRSKCDWAIFIYKESNFSSSWGKCDIDTITIIEKLNKLFPMTVQPAYRIKAIKPVLTVVSAGKPYNKKLFRVGIEKKVITRPPAIYSNLSHEDILNTYWDQLDAKDQVEYLKLMTL
jgi:hypothetical protein